MKCFTTAAVALAVLAAAAPAQADTTELVTEADVTRQAENTPPTDDWVLYTRAGTPPSAGQFVDGPEQPPLGVGSFQLTTTSGSEKVFLFNFDHLGTRLADVEEIGYSTFRTAGQLQQVTALNVQTDVNGDAPGGFTTLVYEPVYNGTVQSGRWQTWDAEGGRWWSTRDIPGVCAFNCFVPFSEIVAANPGAVVGGGVGVNQGSGNPGLTSAVDAFTFDETTYDFERRAVSAEDCKKGGWETYAAYKNQGDCVSDAARSRD